MEFAHGSVFHRNPVATALGSLLALALACVVALNAESLPLIGNGAAHHAEFSEAGGLTTGADVRVAGVRVGKVTGVELTGDHVDVSFTAGDSQLGDHTGAAIKLGSLLGQKYLALDPRGSGALDAPIPRSRTTSLYDVMAAFQGLSGTVGRIDTEQLARSFGTMSETFRGTSQETTGAIRGLSALSGTIASRDQQLQELLRHTNDVAGIVRSRNEQFQQLLGDGNQLLSEVRQRRDSIRALLSGTRALSAQLTAMVDENSAQLRPTLDGLDQVTRMLARNQQNLDASISKLAPFYRTVANTLGNGRWIDVYVCGLLPPATGPVNARGCTA